MHVVRTINVGGSREALINAMETAARILLVEEHRAAGAGLPGLQGLAMGKGRQCVWDAAKANGNGRSGGTAELVRRPAQIMRGVCIVTGTRAVISWMRRNRVHVASIHTAPEVDPQHEDTTRRVVM